MPPILIRRNATGKIEHHVVKGMPLGSVRQFPYEILEIGLWPGDTVVVMSDGFPERFNERGEMLGYSKAKEILEDAADIPPESIIERYVQAGETWGGKRPQDDDMTFIVMKVKEKSRNSSDRTELRR